ncbi:HNH endonuclease [Streptomyces sp. NPDC052043]|uniref:HNH endonuclease n=1 Tax=Streptomyces sp. NPDC052043 TaxID=3365684 RepID=UPI0037D630DF
MAVSKRLRYEIFRRDAHTCRCCGASAPDVPLRVDHVTPVALGGTDTADNLVTSCEPCNSGKSSSSPDATHVAAVSDDALRWADAMKQAAGNLREQETPKLEYRDAFLGEWNRWHVGKDDANKVPLPKDWKQSVERFRVAGIPVWMWADIVDAGMGNDKVKPDNTFRYCCGIAWNKVTELQAEARRIVGASQAPASTDSREAVLMAAFTVWRCGLIENEEPPTAQQEEEFRSSLANISDREWTEPERIIQAAQFATYFGITDITAALHDMDRDTAWRAWLTAWPTTWVSRGEGPWDGESVGGPSDEAMKQVRQQIDKLLEADIYVARLVRAASHAGIHKSVRIYHGLSDDELQATGVNPWRSQASELWRIAFTASGEIEPSKEETSRFFASLSRIGEDGNFCVGDVYIAASAAGAYQDPDVTTCLPRRLSALEAASAPLQPTS